MTRSDQIDHLIVLAELYADNRYGVPLEDRRDGSAPRKKKGWYMLYTNTLDMLKKGFLNIRMSSDCGFIPKPKLDTIEIEIPCANAHEGCKNTVHVYVSPGSTVSRKYCYRCKSVGSPDNRGYGALGDSALCMGATAHHASP